MYNSSYGYNWTILCVFTEGEGLKTVCTKLMKTVCVCIRTSDSEAERKNRGRNAT